jgi:hypothetical protein
MSLLIHIAFFDDTGPIDGRLTVGGAGLTGGAFHYIPVYPDQLPHLDLLTRETERPREGMGSKVLVKYSAST